MGGGGQRGQEQAIYYPGTGGQFAGAPSGLIPPGAFRWFAQSTARYGGLPGGGGAGRIPMSAVPREWIGDPRYAGFMSWLRGQGILQPDQPGQAPPEYDVTPLPGAPPPGAPPGVSPGPLEPEPTPLEPEAEPEAPYFPAQPEILPGFGPGANEEAIKFSEQVAGLGGGGTPFADVEEEPLPDEEDEEEEYFPTGPGEQITR